MFERCIPFRIFYKIMNIIHGFYKLGTMKLREINEYVL